MVTVEFAGKKKVANGGEDGKWMVKLDAMKASTEGRELRCQVAGVGVHEAEGIDTRNLTPDTITLKNILVGEVWLCSGQSNMAGKVRHNRKNQDPNDDLMKSNIPAIRHIHAPGGWQMATPKFVGEFTRVGFCFARRVHREIKAPIGLVNACVGGSRIESWMRVPPQKIPKKGVGAKNRILSS